LAWRVGRDNTYIDRAHGVGALRWRLSEMGHGVDG
jgi:hypothetical protein